MTTMTPSALTSLDDAILASEGWIEQLETEARAGREPRATLSALQTFTLRQLMATLRRAELMTERDRIGYYSGRDWAETGRCRHGVNTGNWAGPDLMCGTCESMSQSEEVELLTQRIDELNVAIETPAMQASRLVKAVRS